MKTYTIKDFDKQFPNNDTCLEFLFNARYPDGAFCPKCQKITPHYRIADRKVFSCQFCGSHISPTANTIFHKSDTPLLSWFHAMFLMSSTKTGISAKQLQRELGVTYKTAWRMFKEVRKLMTDNVNPLSGQVEVDETYVGGKSHGTRGRGASGKTIVMGMVERQGNAITRVIPNVQARTLLPMIERNVEKSNKTRSILMNCLATIMLKELAIPMKSCNIPPNNTLTALSTSIRWNRCGEQSNVVLMVLITQSILFTYSLILILTSIGIIIGKMSNRFLVPFRSGFKGCADFVRSASNRPLVSSGCGGIEPLYLTSLIFLSLLTFLGILLLLWFV